MRDESFGGKLRLVEVAAGKSFATNVELTRHADGHWLKPVVQNIHLGIGNRPANGDGGYKATDVLTGGTG